MTLHLHTLGHPAITIGDRHVGPSADILFAGLLVLGLDPGRWRARDEIASMLWPEPDPSTRAARLRWLLSKMRSLGVAIESNADLIRLRGSDISADFQAAARLDVGSIDPVLSGYDPGLSPLFQRWLEEKRESIATETVRQLLPRMKTAVDADDWTLAAKLATAIRTLDPLNEDAVLAGAEAQCRQGARAQAAARLDAYLAAVGDQRPELTLRARVLLRRLEDNIESARHEPRFVGRQSQVHRLTTLLKTARTGRGGAMMVTGPAGIGKTRLIDEVLARNAGTNLQVVRIRCQRSDTLRPLSALNDLSAKVLGLSGALAADPKSFGRLTEFTSATSESAGAADRPSPEVLRSGLGAAILDVIDAAAAEIPVVVVIDDLQWGDRSFAWLWNDLIEWSESHPLALLFGCRTGGSDTPKLPVPTIGIPSLDTSASEELVDELLAATTARVTLEVRRDLLSRSGGSPLFLREFVRQWGESGTTDKLPDSLSLLFEKGVSQLSPIGLRTVQTAAVLGAYATLQRIERVMQGRRDTFIDAIAELEDAGILSVDSSGNVRGHVMWSDVALSALSDSVKSLLHRHAAKCLERELNAEPSVALLWECARHWRCSEQPARANVAIARGAEHLATHGFPGEAADVFGELASACGTPSERLARLKRRADLLHVAGRVHDFAAAGQDHERVAAEIDPSYDRHNDLELMLIESEHFRVGAVTSIVEATLRCVRDPAATSSHRLRAAKECARFAGFLQPDLFGELREVISTLRSLSPADDRNRIRFQIEYHYWVGDLNKACRLAEVNLAEARKQGSPRHIAGCLQVFAIVANPPGRIADARVALGEAVRLCRQFGFLSILAASFENAIALSLEFDTPAISRTLFEEAKAIVWELSRYGNTKLVHFLRNDEAQLLLSEGQPDRALGLMMPLHEALTCPVPRWRARHLAMHVTAGTLLGDVRRTADAAAGLKGCFDMPNSWMDWPAVVLAKYLDQHEGCAAAATFARRFLSEIRRELRDPPAFLAQVCADDMTEARHSIHAQSPSPVLSAPIAIPR